LSKKIMAQGIGPSKLNRDKNAPDDPYGPLKGLHVGGIPIEDLPVKLVVRLTKRHTDEAIAEHDARATGHGIQVGSGGRARVTATDFGKSVEERRDFRADAGPMEIFEAPDPMKELVDRHIQPGMRPKFMSPGRVDRDGTRGFEIVKNENGDPVRMGRMILGQMPEAKARARNEFYRKKGSERLAAIENEHEERQRELVG
jgi:hypothetical protein